MKTTFKIPASIEKKIQSINAMIEDINLSETVPYTYAGGTYPMIVYIKPIVIKNQFVTIQTDEHGTYIDNKERYNVNKSSTFGDEFCKKHLEYTLNIILKTFKKTLAN